MTTLEFSPCSKHCPAVTGKAYGTVHYCPMQEQERHHSVAKQTAAAEAAHNPEDHGGFSFADIRAYPKGEHPFYDHPDYVDCCLNFQCCADNLSSEEKEILGAISYAAMEAIPVVPIEPRKDREND